jgi:cyanophycinase
MEGNSKGFLIIIGGAEDKNGNSIILKQAPQMLSDEDTLTVLTTATEKPEEAGQKYHEVFQRLGVKNVQILNINTRDDANNETYCEKLAGSRCVFMTGGDQLRITSILGGTQTCVELKKIYFTGGIIMGTSAGASVMSSTMIVQGNDNEPARKCTLKMAPGLGFVDGVIIDQHFDQRGRFGRLLCGVAENPDILGIGIDEDTSIKLYPDMHFEVIGSNAITIIDGKTIQSSNVSELKQNEILAIMGVKIHVLPQGYGFDLNSRLVKRLKDKGS